MAGLTLGISSNIKQSGDLKEAQRRINNAYSTLVDAEKAINSCSCVSMEKYNGLVREFNGLSKGSVNKDGYNKLWGEYSKNVDDYNRLSRNTVSKEAFNELKNKWEKDVDDYNALREKYNNLINKFNNLTENSVKDYNNLKDKYNKLVDEYNDKNSDYHDMKEKYDDTKEELHNEKLGHANKMGDEKLRHLGEKSQLQIQNTKLQERLEATNSEKIDLRKRLKDKEDENSRLLIKLDDKNNQLTVLRLESGKKDEEIRGLKNQAKSSDKRAEKSQEELLNEKIRSEKGSLELFANELRVGLEQTNNLTRYHERLFKARKSHNQANIETHENNITGIKEELQNAGISIVNIQEICRKCERIAEFRWELEQSQNQYEAHQEVSTNNF